MNYSKTRKLLTSLVILLSLAIIFDALAILGSGAYLNEADQALKEIIELESKSLLNNPPEDISYNTNFYLQYKTSSGLKQHIKEFEEEIPSRIITFYILVFIFMSCVSLRIYFRKGNASSKIPKKA